MMGYVFQGSLNGKMDLEMACRSINTSISEGYYNVNLDVVDTASEFLTEAEAVLADKEADKRVTDIQILHENAEGERKIVGTMADLRVGTINKSFYSPENQSCNMNLSLWVEPVVEVV